jgi:hypothetical protein
MTIVRYRTKLLTQWLRRYPSAFDIYRRISWIFSRSPLVPVVKRLLARPRVWLGNAANGICPIWIGPRCWLVHYYGTHGEFRKATAIADDVLARFPDLDERDRSTNYLSPVYALQGSHDRASQVIELIGKRKFERTRALQYDRLGLHGPIPAVTGTKDDILMPKQYRLDKEGRYLPRKSSAMLRLK